MRIVVSNIPRDADPKQIERLFGSYGPASVHFFGLDRAYVDMPDVAQSYAAIKGLDGWQFHGQSLAVTEVKLETQLGL